MRHCAALLRVFVFFVLFISLRSVAAEASSADTEMVQIETTHVVESSMGHVVILKARNKVIPIFVDAVVAQSIHGALTGDKFPRPLSHDLMHDILEGFEGKVSRVVISLKGATYYADVTVVMHGSTKVFDSRSSDAIALAIHFNAPMLVSRKLLDEVGRSLEDVAEPKAGETRL